jgi:LacI family transcriptional regulator
MSLVGFDDVPMTELLQPPLTAVRQPIEALGRQGFLALFALLNGETPRPLTRLPVELIVRGSVSSPPKKGR